MGMQLIGASNRRLTRASHSAVAEDGADHAPGPCTRFAVHIRTLHALDLVTSNLGRGCPIARVSVNNGAAKTCMAAQHAKNHSIWKRHALTFNLEASEWFSIQAAILCDGSGTPLSARDSKSTDPVELGSLGELRLPVKPENYELTQFFQLFRRARTASAINRNSAPYTLVPAGRVKLRIQYEVVKPVEPPPSTTDKPSIASAVVGNPPSRSFFGTPTSFLENLQLQRKKLKATVVPVAPTDSVTAGSDSVASNSTDLVFFAREIALLPAHDVVRADELQYLDQRTVGEGAHSCVRRAILASAKDSRGGDGYVAVKEFRYLNADAPPRKVVEAFLHEYRILTLLPQGSANVTAFEGIVLQPKLAILMEFCAHGSIAQLMSNVERWRQVTLAERSAIALQLARGIACLHKHDIVHRDIKPHNILLTSNAESGGQLVAKVGDLGSAAIHPPGVPPLTEEVGSSGYTAPEIFAGHGGYDRKVDVWSFAIVFWEIFALSARPDNPFVGMNSDEFVRRASEGVRPEIASLGSVQQHGPLQKIELAFRRVVEACWAFNPADRPTMDEVVRTVEQINEEIKSHYLATLERLREGLGSNA